MTPSGVELVEILDPDGLAENIDQVDDVYKLNAAQRRNQLVARLPRCVPCRRLRLWHFPAAQPILFNLEGLEHLPRFVRLAWTIEGEVDYAAFTKRRSRHTA